MKMYIVDCTRVNKEQLENWCYHCLVSMEMEGNDPYDELTCMFPDLGYHENAKKQAVRLMREIGFEIERID